MLCFSLYTTNPKSVCAPTPIPIREFFSSFATKNPPRPTSQLSTNTLHSHSSTYTTLFTKSLNPLTLGLFSTLKGQPAPHCYKERKQIKITTLVPNSGKALPYLPVSLDHFRNFTQKRARYFTEDLKYLANKRPPRWHP